jgi:hypothetical protein
LDRTHYKRQTNKQGSHCSPTGSRGNNIFPFIWEKQIAVGIKMRALLSWTSTPLQNQTRISQASSSLAVEISKKQEEKGSPDRRGKQA